MGMHPTRIKLFDLMDSFWDCEDEEFLFHFLSVLMKILQWSFMREIKVDDDVAG